MLCDHVSYYFALQLDYVGFQCSRDGYVFEGSMNVTQYAFCSGGQWIYNFDLDAMCERKRRDTFGSVQLHDDFFSSSCQLCLPSWLPERLLPECSPWEA